MLKAKLISQLIIAYKLSPFIKRAVIIKITVAIILFAYWNLGKTEVFRQLDLAVVEMKALDTRNATLLAKIKDVGMVNQAIQKMEFNVVDSGKVFAGATLDAELLTLVNYHCEKSGIALVSLSPKSTPVAPKAAAMGPKPAPQANTQASAQASAQAKTQPTPKQEEEPSQRIGSAYYEVAVTGSFGGIMNFVDSLVHDKRHLRLETMQIAAAADNSPSPAGGKADSNSTPTARIGLGVYVLSSPQEVPL